MCITLSLCTVHLLTADTCFTVVDVRVRVLQEALMSRIVFGFELDLAVPIEQNNRKSMPISRAECTETGSRMGITQLPFCD